MRYRRGKQCLALVLVGLFVGSPAIAAERPPADPSDHRAPPPVLDIALSSDGLLRGVLSENTSAPVSRATIEARDSRGRVAKSTETSVQGEFQIAGLKGGVHDLTFEGQSVSCRVWKHGCAPPAAVDRLLLVRDANIVRGQIPRRPVLFLIPVATAVGVYIAVKEREERPKGS